MAVPPTHASIPSAVTVTVYLTPDDVMVHDFQKPCLQRGLLVKNVWSRD